jgi:hypothetical protein
VASHKPSDEFGVPLKWKKYLKLVEYGFITFDELQADIRRFPRFRAKSLIREIGRDVGEESSKNRRNLYVVKLVAADLQGQLPNFRIESSSELKKLPEFLRVHDNGPHNELWFCRTRIDNEVFSVAGRILFSNEGGIQSQLIEQLWRTSPRLLERYPSALPCPYVRAYRHGWAWSYSLEEVRLPLKEVDSRERVLHEFYYSLRLIEQERERIELFVAHLNSFSFPAFSLEYKITGSKFSLIDWDTPDDRRVLIS